MVTSNISAFIRSALMLLIVYVGTLSTAGQTANILQGSVEHADKLPPVESYLRAGVQFDPSVLKRTASQIDWYLIPDWFSGTWVNDGNQTTTLYKFNYRTGQANTVPSRSRILTNDEVWGNQQDKTEGIWQSLVVPYQTETLFPDSNEKEISIVELVKPIKISKDKAVILFRSKRIRINNNTSIIIHTLQNESIQTYTQAGASRVQCYSSMKEFDENGNQIDLINVEKFCRQTAPFDSVDYDEHGNDLKSSFRDYLTSHGLADLIPD